MTTTKTLRAGIIALAVSAAVQVQAQNFCPQPNAGVDLNTSNIRARINTSGTLFNDGVDAQFAYKLANNQPSSIYMSALWMGGTDDAGNLRLAAPQYRLENSTEYTAGPLDATTGSTDPNICANWDRVFYVTANRIESFSDQLAQLAGDPATAISLFPEIMGWPGQNNPYFSTVWNFQQPDLNSLAPYLDIDGDGVYNPLKGDLPTVLLQGKAPFIPAEIAWCVFNDNGAAHTYSFGQPVGMEVQLTAWSFNAANTAPLSNTVFTSHKLIYRGTDNLNNFAVGIWTDFDLGCYADDYIGCSPEKNTFFAYNQDAVDGQPGTQCLGVPAFGNETPVQTATFLNKSMDKFMYFNSSSVGGAPIGTLEPATPIAYYQYLNGIWHDGVPLTAGNTGYNPDSTNVTDYAYPDDPSIIDGWSMCATGSTVNDQRTVASHIIPVLQPGAVNELTMAWTLHPDIAGPCSIDGVLVGVDDIQEAYDNGFQGISSVFTPNLEGLISVWPNPSAGAVTLDFKDLKASALLCYNAEGRLMYQQQNLGTSTNHRIAAANWPAGQYFAHVITDKGVVPVRFILSR